MDPLDLVLQEAWDRMGARVRHDRVQALQRSRRRFKGVLTRPMREWCLVLRASDTRLNDFSAIIEPRRGYDAHEPHTVTLDGALIRKLTRPVMIPWPGVTSEQAASLCGREWQTIKGWIRKGVFRVDHYAEFKFPHTCRRGKDGAARGAEERGGRPYVWTPSPIDPNNFDGRVPHAVWGTLWQWLWEKAPENYELVVRREPRLRMFRGKLCFRGWNFICPGRVDEEGNYQTCGRACTYLYGPQTVWTLAKALSATGSEQGFDMPQDCGLAGQWHPGVTDPIASRGLRSFACKTCWGVRSACMANRNGWNEFITQISGGLLYGRDVKRPPDICPVERKKRPYRRRVRMVAATLAVESPIQSFAGER